ncbi:MAG: hypothetical protein SAJ37_21090 [Oscillatoria sp. PMC 1068.18]|nr:hypothetical protein [Oscillatoria sp. PMC 1076.18]MEC4991238.1 hypothetical protein [Oscillatoria sp. PMC 1068.18]
MKTTTFKLPAIATGLLIFSAASLPVANAQTPQQNPRNRYPQELVNNYTKTCLASSVDSGLTQQQAQILCNCTLREFQNRYTLEQFGEIMQQARGGTIPESVTEIGLSCAEELIN